MKDFADHIQRNLDCVLHEEVMVVQMVQKNMHQ